jgi:hypothetical protein
MKNTHTKGFIGCFWVEIEGGKNYYNISHNFMHLRMNIDK